MLRPDKGRCNGVFQGRFFDEPIEAFAVGKPSQNHSLLQLCSSSK
jgi:hypothetical protein